MALLKRGHKQLNKFLVSPFQKAQINNGVLVKEVME